MLEIVQQDFIDLFFESFKKEHPVIWIRDSSLSHQLYVSEQYKNVWGASCAELYENPKSWAQYYIEDQISFSKFHNIVANQHTYLYYSIRDTQGKIKSIKDRSFKLFNKKNQSTVIIGMALDLDNTAHMKFEDPYYNNVQRKVTEILAQHMNFTESVDEKKMSLTNRESQVLYYTLRGKTAKSIARVLNVSTKAAEFHIANLKKKFGCSNKSQLIERAIDDGYMLLTLEDNPH